VADERKARSSLVTRSFERDFIQSRLHRESLKSIAASSLLAWTIISPPQSRSRDIVAFYAR